MGESFRQPWFCRSVGQRSWAAAAREHQNWMPSSIPMRRPQIAATSLGAAALLTVLATGICLPASAEMSVERLRAANLARMTAESMNGGLSRYFTADCMHQRGGGPCLIQNNNNGFLFRFLGGPPGWQTYGQAATVETQILISPDGRTVNQVQYNGAPQAGLQPQ